MFSDLFIGAGKAVDPSQQKAGGTGGSAMSRMLAHVRGQSQQAMQRKIEQQLNYHPPQSYQAPQSYEPFAQSFQQQQRPPVTDIYQRGAMPNDLLARYNSMAQMLQQQQAAMVPRTQPQMMPEGQAPWMGKAKPNPYTNFAQLFGGRNG